MSIHWDENKTVKKIGIGHVSFYLQEILIDHANRGIKIIYVRLEFFKLVEEKVKMLVHHGTK